MTMDVSYIAHDLKLTDGFREHVAERAARLEPLAGDATQLEVKVTKSSHHRHSEESVTVELTVRGPRDVIRAESSADDKLAAFDLACGRLAERLRRLRDRRKDRRTGRGAASSRGAGEVAFVPPLPAAGADLPAAGADAADDGEPQPGTPVRIREKAFPATPMGVDEAVDAMELVGHDFYLFQNAETGVPSVVYRRRGWSYGVIRLDESLPADHVAGQRVQEREYQGSAD